MAAKKAAKKGAAKKKAARSKAGAAKPRRKQGGGTMRVQCLKKTYGPWRRADGRWEGFNGDEVFDTELALEDLPDFIVPYEGTQPTEGERADVEFVGAPEAQPVERVPQTLADGAGHENRIMLALNQLDHDDASHWTEGGMPDLDTVNALIEEAGGEPVTQAQMHNTAPDFQRSQ